MSEFYCECGRDWLYAYNQIGCPDCGARKPCYMDGMNRRQAEAQERQDYLGAVAEDAIREMDMPPGFEDYGCK